MLFQWRNYFLDTGTQVVAFDAQFTAELAQKSLDFLKTKTNSPVSHLVVTHPNPDKFNGISVFKRAGAIVISSKATAEAMPGVHAYKKYYFVHIAKMFKDDTYPKLDSIDQTFDQSLDLELKSGEHIQLSELSGPGVSSNQTVAYIPSNNALVVGDLVHDQVHAWLEGGIVNGKPTPTIASWIKDLNEVNEKFQNVNPVIYGGRGNARVLSQSIPAQISYLTKADEIVGRYVLALGERKVELTNDKSGVHFAALQKEFEASFPTYGLSYMIQYGVYGLAQSK
jgi:glyoxylase-like metal-dependent hydrolase (beta-lactamase superfamily II)